MSGVGIVGAGRMGGAIATSLRSRGQALIVFDVSPAATARMVELGASVAGSAAEVAASSDVILVVVVDDTQARQAMAGPGGILEGSTPGSTVLLVSTIHPGTAVQLGEQASEQGVDL